MKIMVHNCVTGESEERDMTPEEIAAHSVVQSDTQQSPTEPTE